MLTETQKRNIIFLILYDEFKKTQEQIAAFLDVSQGTVSLGIKEARYLRTIKQHQAEINILKDQLALEMTKHNFSYRDGIEE